MRLTQAEPAVNGLLVVYPDEDMRAEEWELPNRPVVGEVGMS